MRTSNLALEMTSLSLTRLFYFRDSGTGNSMVTSICVRYFINTIVRNILKYSHYSIQTHAPYRVSPESPYCCTRIILLNSTKAPVILMDEPCHWWFPSTPIRVSKCTKIVRIQKYPDTAGVVFICKKKVVG